MKRRPPLLMILLLLVAGAIVNVAVAWGCAASSKRWFPMIADNVPDFEQVGWWQRHSPAGVEAIPRGLFESSGHGVIFEHLYPLDTSPTGICAERIRAGWPMLSFEGGLWARNDFGPVVSRRGVISDSPSLPYLPVWPGFAINTVFYAGVLWLLFAAPLALRRRRRIKRGLCPKCAYPVGTSDVCTECGATVGSSTVPVDKMR